MGTKCMPFHVGRQAGTWNLLTQRQKDSPVWGSDHRQANNITVQSSCGASWNVEWPEDWEICQAEISGLLFHQMQNLFTRCRFFLYYFHSMYFLCLMVYNLGEPSVLNFEMLTVSSQLNALIIECSHESFSSQKNNCILR